MKKSIMILGAVALLFTSCVRELIYSGDGRLSLKLTMEGETKAAMSQNELLSSAIIKIYKADFSGLVRQYVKSEMPNVLFLPADSYRIDVEAGEIAKAQPSAASWEQMSWKGSADVTITAAVNTATTVTAKVCNVVSQVKFDPTVGQSFESGYSLTVALDGDAQKQLTYTASENGKDGYFIAEGFEPSLVWSFRGIRKKDGVEVTKNGTISAVEGGKRYLLGLRFTETDGLLDFSVNVDDSVSTKYDDITFIATSTGVAETDKYDVWAGHFKANADVDESEYDKDKVYFEYRTADGSSWSRIAATRESEGTYFANVTGLAPSTTYDYRLVVTPVGGGEEEYLDAPESITTEAAPSVPNSSFETTSNAESSKYKSLYDPDSSLPELQTKWWDNGNAGSTLVGSSAVICYPDSDAKEGSQSMCLQSRWVVVKFAAGNLFSGHFGELQGTQGGTVFFGRPFTGRPTALRLWVKYSGGVVNRTGDAPSSLIKAGDYDRASLKIALGTWDYKTYGGDAQSPVLVNTTDTSTFIDYSTDPSTIAFAEEVIMSDADNSTNVWRQITIPLQYKNTNKYPTHIVISFAASMYGDYFAGYDDSKLWVDNVELLYE